MTAPSIAAGWQAGANIANNTSLSVNKPTDTTDKTLFIVYASDADGATASISGGNAWNVIAGPITLPTPVGVGVGYIWSRAAGTEPASYTITSTVSERATAVAFAVSGMDGYNVSAVADSGTNAAPAVGDITTTVADCLRLSIILCAGDRSPVGTFTGHTKGPESYYTSAGTVSVQYKTLAGTGTDSGVATTLGSSGWATVTLAFAPAPTGTVHEAAAFALTAATVTAAATKQHGTAAQATTDTHSLGAAGVLKGGTALVFTTVATIGAAQAIRGSAAQAHAVGSVGASASAIRGATALAASLNTAAAQGARVGAGAGNAASAPAANVNAGRVQAVQAVGTVEVFAAARGSMLLTTRGASGAQSAVSGRAVRLLAGQVGTGSLNTAAGQGSAVRGGAGFAGTNAAILATAARVLAANAKTIAESAADGAGALVATGDIGATVGAVGSAGATGNLNHSGAGQAVGGAASWVRAVLIRTGRAAVISIAVVGATPATKVVMAGEVHAVTEALTAAVGHAIRGAEGRGVCVNTAMAIAVCLHTGLGTVRGINVCAGHAQAVSSGSGSATGLSIALVIAGVIYASVAQASATGHAWALATDIELYRVKVQIWGPGSRARVAGPGKMGSVSGPGKTATIKGYRG